MLVITRIIHEALPFLEVLLQALPCPGYKITALLLPKASIVISRFMI